MRERGKGEGTVQEVTSDGWDRDRGGPSKDGMLMACLISALGKGEMAVLMGDLKELPFLRGGPKAEGGNDAEAGRRNESELCTAC